MTERLYVTRAQLASFLKDPQAIKQFEMLFKATNQLVPDGFNEVAIAAENARSTSQQALGELQRIADALEMLALAQPKDYAPLSDDLAVPGITWIAEDNLTPPVVIGSLGHQQADNVAISGGTITAALIGNQTTLIATSVSLGNGAGTALGTLTNAPSAGNPTKWVAIDDNGTPRYIPTW